jgi:hypothetical protein
MMMTDDQASKRYTNRWYVHCRNVQAELLAQGKKWSWADILQFASQSYTKKERKSNKHGVTWVEYAKVYASIDGCTYTKALKSEECQRLWREFNTEPEPEPEPETITYAKGDVLVCNGDFYHITDSQGCNVYTLDKLHKVYEGGYVYPIERVARTVTCKIDSSWAKHDESIKYEPVKINTELQEGDVLVQYARIFREYQFHQVVKVSETSYTLHRVKTLNYKKDDKLIRQAPSNHYYSAPNGVTTVKKSSSEIRHYFKYDSDSTLCCL